jgi:hypothetical protein
LSSAGVLALTEPEADQVEVLPALGQAVKHAEEFAHDGGFGFGPVNGHLKRTILSLLTHPLPPSHILLFCQQTLPELSFL